MSSNYSTTPLDRKINSDFMRVCKCVIPYLDRDIQKNIAIGIKFLELINTFNLYANDDSITEISLTRGDNWENDLLTDIKRNISPEKAFVIDAVMKLSEFRSILQDGESTEDTTQIRPTFSTDSFVNTSSPLYNNEASENTHYTDSTSLYNDHRDYPTPNTNHTPTDYAPPVPFSNTDQPTDSIQPNNNTTTPSPQSFIDAFSPFINDEQKQLLNVLTSLLGNPPNRKE